MTNRKRKPANRSAPTERKAERVGTPSPPASSNLPPIAPPAEPRLVSNALAAVPVAESRSIGKGPPAAPTPSADVRATSKGPPAGHVVATRAADAATGASSRRIVVDLRDLRKTYHLGDTIVHALNGVNLQFEEGDFVAIMGSSGSGKSTLLNLLGCLDRPTSGSYFLGDRDIAQLDDDTLSEIRSRQIGFIFQSYNLIQQLTVVENIEVPLYYQGATGPETREYCIQLARMVGLGERLDHRPTQLSGGQQQRVAVARSLVNNPFIILADEATGNLDTKTSVEIMTLLSQLNASGKTIIMVTHEEDIANWAHRVIRMRDGQVIDDHVRPPVH